MKSITRLDRAITKLYNAFHDGTLNPECCKSCAVGNICNNTDAWKHLTDAHGSVVLNYVGKVNEAFGKRIGGYTPSELLKIEAVFLSACGYSLPFSNKGKKPKDATDKNMLFNGLAAVIEYLCFLDGVANVMDYSRLFEFEADKAVNELELPILSISI